MAGTKLELIGGQDSTLGEFDRLLSDPDAVALEQIPMTIVTLDYVQSRISAIKSALVGRALASSVHRERQEPDRHVSVKEAARLLGVSTDYVYEHQDELAAIRHGRRVLFSYHELQRYLKNGSHRRRSRREP